MAVNPGLPEAWIHDRVRRVWLHFTHPTSVAVAHSLTDVPLVIASAEAASASGLWAVGFVAYEAATAFDPALSTHPPHPRQPLAWFGLFPPPREAPPPAALPLRIEAQPDLAQSAFIERIARIQAAIALGETYQVNLTFRLNATDVPDPRQVFAQLQAAQPGGYGAYLDLGDIVVASASPELFWRLEGETITMRPMKGTRRRGRWPIEDEALAAELVSAAKDRAENVMIVDMARNDLGKIARIGSVRVPELFTAERYPTLWQMTSTVQAETTAGLGEILRACFPCASITGAPKASTMRLITALEDTPRGVYTGAIGYWAPGRRAQFNVAIRTAVIDVSGTRLSYGVGSGIVWDSEAVDEYHECLLKARTLTEPVEPFDLFETLRWSPGMGFWLEERHLARLSGSAQRFAFICDLEAVREALRRAVAGHEEPCRVRLTLSSDGRVAAVASPAPPVALEASAAAGRAPLGLRWALEPVDRRDPLLYHKTTRRDLYDKALAVARGQGPCDDIIMWNEAGEVTETTIGNLVIEVAGRLWTPPVEAGLLAGTFRQSLLDCGAVVEGPVTRAMVGEAQAFWRVNSLRGWERARVRGD